MGFDLELRCGRFLAAAAAEEALPWQTGPHLRGSKLTATNSREEAAKPCGAQVLGIAGLCSCLPPPSLPRRSADENDDNGGSVWGPRVSGIPRNCKNSKSGLRDLSRLPRTGYTFLLSWTAWALQLHCHGWCPTQQGPQTTLGTKRMAKTNEENCANRTKARQPC